jgi:hypothetical protein
MFLRKRNEPHWVIGYSSDWLYTPGGVFAVWQATNVAQANVAIGLLSPTTDI